MQGLGQEGQGQGQGQGQGHGQGQGQGQGEPRLGDEIHIVADIDDTFVISDDAFGEEAALPLVAVVVLLQQLVAALGRRVHIHFVTARLHDPHDSTTHEWTLDQLRKIRAPPHSSLHLAPEAARVSRVAVSRWKFAVRKSIALAAHAPIVLTIGDQVSDLMPLDTEEGFERFEAQIGADTTPYALVRPGDGVSLWGLKLRDRQLAWTDSKALLGEEGEDGEDT